jgi:hypothetical protein
MHNIFYEQLRAADLGTFATPKQERAVERFSADQDYLSMEVRVAANECKARSITPPKRY